MPISTIDTKALVRLTPQQIADLALQADQESRRAADHGDYRAARGWDAESARLAEVFRGAG